MSSSNSLPIACPNMCGNNRLTYSGEWSVEHIAPVLRCQRCRESFSVEMTLTVVPNYTYSAPNVAGVMVTMTTEQPHKDQITTSELSITPKLRLKKESVQDEVVLAQETDQETKQESEPAPPMFATLRDMWLRAQNRFSQAMQQLARQVGL